MTLPQSRRFRAPGKLMLAGEYSVLAPGGEALALAVELGVEVEAVPRPSWELRRQESGIAWHPGEPVPEALRFAHAAWEEARTVLGEPPPHALSSRGHDRRWSDGTKPGLGGSASATVAVTAAMQALAGGSLEGDGRERLLSVALRAHQRAQGGRGSGYDVATATLGGLVRFRGGAGSVAPRASVLAWPEGLSLLAGYSGSSAPTGPLLSHVASIAGPLDLEADLHSLAAPVSGLIEAFARGDGAAVLEGARACHRALRAWDRLHGLGLVTGELARLVTLGEEAGAACKISGAGGGDSVIALAESQALLEEVARRWQAAGFLAFWPPATADGVREV